MCIIFAAMGLSLFVNKDFFSTSTFAASGISAQSTLKSATEKSTTQKNSVLSCGQIHDRVREFLKMHYSVRSFDDQLAKRTTKKYFQMLDPGKNVLLESDVKKFSYLENKLPQMIEGKDCGFIKETHDLYVTRLKQVGNYVNDILAKPFDFNVNEKMEVDRKKIEWAKNDDEIKERWRKQYKFFALGMKETDPNAKDSNQRLKKRYQMLLKAVENRTMDEVHRGFMNAFALSLDPHSEYQLPADQEEFKVAFSLQLVGIGASLSMDDGYTVVESVIAGGAAARDGRLQKEDKIIAVDSGDGSGFTDVIDMELNKVVQLIRGKKSTKVNLLVLRKDTGGKVTRFTIDLTRDVVKLADQAAKSDVLDVNGKKIGIINLPGFYIDYRGYRDNVKNFRSSYIDIMEEVKKLRSKKVDGIILDLRRNGGGDLGECIKISGLFIDRGSVVQVKNRQGKVESLDDPEPGTFYNGPFAILTSKLSASASEILSGAIQDYGRGLIIGNSRTYGKGTVQNIVDIPGTQGREFDGAIKVTVSKFFRPSGKSNQEKGVLADIVIPDIFEAADISESENDYALPYDTIQSAKSFQPINDLNPIVSSLKKKSEERLAKSKEFKELKEQIAKAEKEKQDTQLSLKFEPNKKKKDEKELAKNGKKSKKDGKKKRAEEENKVIREDDIQLVEAANVLVDSIKLAGTEDWTKKMNLQK